MLPLSFSAFGKRASATDAQNCFLNCLLPKEAASAIDSDIDEIEMEILRASCGSEFSHSLDPTRTLQRPLAAPSSCVPASRRSTFRDSAPEFGRTCDGEDFANVFAQHLTISCCISRQRTAPVPQHG